MILRPNKNLTITGATSSVTLKLAGDVGVYYFSGTATLGGNVSLVTSGTVREGMVCAIIFDTSLTLAGNHVTVLGTQIVDALAIVGFWAFAVYSNSAWHIIYMKNVAGTSGGIGTDSNGNLQVNAGTITNAMVNASAAIALNKLAALTASHMVGSDGSGVLAVLDTATYPSLAELAYLKGITSAIQTQLNAKTTSGAIVNTDINASAAIAYTKLALAGAILNSDLAGSIAYAKLILTGSVVDADINASAAITLSKLASLTASQILVSSAGGVITPSGVSSAKAAYLANVTSDIQTQINAIAAAAVSNTSINGNVTLTAATIKQKTRQDVTSGAVAITLPLANTMVAGSLYSFIQIGAAGAATLLTQGTDKISDTGGSPQTTITIGGAGKIVNLVCDGTSVYSMF
jgi:hypothetical protein